MELVLFYQLQECRYMVYWNLVSIGFGRTTEEVGRARTKQMELDAVTLDRVICGEQQPELIILWRCSTQTHRFR